MTEGSGAKGAPHPFTDEARALGIDVDDPGVRVWMEAHLPEWRQQASGQRPLYWILGIGFVVGLAAHIGGYLLRSSVTTEPLGLLADLLYSLGFALWTGVVVVVFVQIWPEAKRRQLKRSLDAYDAALREEAQPEAARRRGTTERRRRGRSGYTVGACGRRSVRRQRCRYAVRLSARRLGTIRRRLASSHARTAPLSSRGDPAWWWTPPHGAT